MPAAIPSAAAAIDDQDLQLKSLHQLNETADFGKEKRQTFVGINLCNG